MIKKINTLGNIDSKYNKGVRIAVVTSGLAIAALFGINKISQSLIKDKLDERGYQITEISWCPECIFTNPELLTLSKNSFSYKFTAKDSLGNETHGVGGSNLLITKVSIDQE